MTNSLKVILRILNDKMPNSHDGTKSQKKSKRVEKKLYIITDSMKDKENTVLSYA